MKIRTSSIISIGYMFTTIIIFFTLVYPSLTGKIDIRAFNDVDKYVLIAQKIVTSNYLALTNISHNNLGPVVILKMFNYDYIAIFVFNVGVFFLFIQLLFKYCQINRTIFLTFLFLNPTTLFSLCYPSKELLTLLTLIVFMIYMERNNFFLLLITIFMAYFARWQLLLFIVIAVVFIAIDRYSKNRFLVFVLFLSMISILFPAFVGMFEHVISYAGKGVISDSSIFSKMNLIQQNYYGGYLIVFIPKLLQLLFGLISRANMVTDLSAFWMNVVQFFNSISFLILSLYLIYKKKINMRYIFFYLAIIFSAIFALTPIYSIRYFYGMYILLCMLAAKKEVRTIFTTRQQNL